MSRRLKLANGTRAGPTPPPCQAHEIAGDFLARAGDGRRNGGGGRKPCLGSPKVSVLTGGKQVRGPVAPGGPYTSCSASPPPRPRSRRGGARNSAARVSFGVTDAQMENMVAAAAFALAIGLPLNRFITIAWECCGIEDDLTATMYFLRRAREWLAHQGEGFACVWFREWGPKRRGHVHILLHLPPHLARAFNAMAWRWRKACGAVWTQGAIKSVPVGRSLRTAFMGVEDGVAYAPELSKVLGYLAKGVSDDFRGRHRWKSGKPGGAVVGKRCGTSQNIGAKARRAARPLIIQRRNTEFILSVRGGVSESIARV